MQSIVYNADCLAAMREMPDKAFSIAVCDPPYGINVTAKHKCKNTSSLVGGGRPFGGYRTNTRRAGKWQTPHRWGSDNEGQKQKLLVIPPGFYHAFDDGSPPDAEWFRELFRVSENQVIFGANFLLDYLPKTSCMIVWDKKRRGMDQADCEIAWTSFKGQSRIFDFRWNGMLQGNMKHKEERIHPTQKPVALYAWVFDKFAKPGDTILDTHLGSGSSRIAAWERGLDFTGYEIDKVFYDAQEKRFQEHTAQLSLFVHSEQKEE